VDLGIPKTGKLAVDALAHKSRFKRRPYASSKRNCKHLKAFLLNLYLGVETPVQSAEPLPATDVEQALAVEAAPKDKQVELTSNLLQVPRSLEDFERAITA